MAALSSISYADSQFGETQYLSFFAAQKFVAGLDFRNSYLNTFLHFDIQLLLSHTDKLFISKK